MNESKFLIRNYQNNFDNNYSYGDPRVQNYNQPQGGYQAAQNAYPQYPAQPQQPGNYGGVFYKPPVSGYPQQAIPSDAYQMQGSPVNYQTQVPSGGYYQPPPMQGSPFDLDPVDKRRRIK